MKKVTTAILAGGKSSRMGSDKGLAEFDGQPLINSVLKVVDDITGNIIIISNQEGYEDLGYPVFEDIHKNKGPAGGIHSALTHSDCDYNLVLACDMPNVNADLIRYLITHNDDDSNFDAYVPRYEENIEPLCTIYSKSCLHQIEVCIKENDLKMMDILKKLKTKYIEITSDLDFYSPSLFENVNTKQDLENLQE